MIFKGKVAFGNKMVETTLCLHFESAAAIYGITKVITVKYFEHPQHNYCWNSVYTKCH